MKRSISVIFAVMIVFCTQSLSLAEESKIPDALAVIHSRKSVRHFTGEAVSKEALEKIVRAGMAAPTAVNMQPWEFVIVSERKALDALASELPYAKMLDKAGAAIIVCALPASSFQGSKEFAILDASCASENILLAVEALGLGGLWTAAYPDEGRMQLVRVTLGIPQDAIPLNVIPIGHPTGEDTPKDKYKPEKVHWEKW